MLKSCCAIGVRVPATDGFYPLTNSAFPIAATTMSAFAKYDGISAVREWQVVTVAFIDWSNEPTGIPTMFDRPITTAFFPDRLP